jgi:hypothetical protein
VARGMSPSEFQRKVREAQRKFERDIKHEFDRVNRANQKAVDDYNRRAERHNQRVVDNYNREVARVNQQNQQVVNDLNKQLAAASRPRVTSYTVQERQLVERVHEAILQQDDRVYHVFLSYARADGSDVAQELRDLLGQLGVTVWQDELRLQAGKSISREIDRGLLKARAGVAVLTPAYLQGRFWTERELGALLHKDTLIPVLHGVTFADVKKYSGILPDLLGFTTADDSVAAIAEKIADTVLAVEAA